jgi:rubrerythrin
MQTITLVRDDRQDVTPVFRCSECGDVFGFALLTHSQSGSWDNLKMIGTPQEQKPRYCPVCGAKNKAK